MRANGIKEVVAATQEAGRVLANLSRTAVKLSSQSTSALCGVAGGTFGIALAYALSLVVAISLPIASTILCSLGIVTGILAYRGRRRIAMESRLDENRLAAEEILRRIKKLPADAPEDVKATLWQTYRQLNSMTLFVPRQDRLPELRE